MRAYFSYTLELDEGETPETLARQCRALECPCVDLMAVNGSCPLGSTEVNGLCRLESPGTWRAALQQKYHEADI